MGRVFIFNPDCELAIANGGKYYTPPANIVQMADDLAFLPAYLGDPGDYILLPTEPDEAFGEQVEQLNPGCKGITDKDTEKVAIETGEPWGKSPKMCHWLAERGWGEEWRPEWKEDYSRKTAKKGLEKLLMEMPFLETDLIPQICFSVEDIQSRACEGEFLVKAPWSSSGKGLLTLTNGVGLKEKEWLNGMFRRQGYLMLEKKFDKIQDFAMEFYGNGKEVGFIGWSSFFTGSNGEYRGNYAGPQDHIEKALANWIGQEKVKRLKQIIPRMLTGLLPGYKGFFGVDLFVYRNKEGNFCIHPCVEINLRYNMGIVALFLSQRYLNEGVEGEFTICFYPGKGAALKESMRLQKEAPVVYKNNRIVSGYLNLTPVTMATHFVASIRCY